jgi:sulfite exporter TauE/SafE
MTPLEFSTIFGLGVVSSVHCAQMCGPVVLAYSLPLAKPLRWRRLMGAHAGYNLGRICTYSMLGAIAGTAGGLVERLAAIASASRILAGLAMLAAAVALSGLLPRARLVQVEQGGWFSRSIGRLLRSPGKFRLGLVLGFMPCGLVYAALLKAVDSGTAAAGALTMLAFGLGTAGALATIGMASSAVGWRVSRWSNVLSAASIAAMGAFLLWRGLAGDHSGHVHHG